MTNPLKFSLFSLLICLVYTGCQKKATDKVSVTVKLDSAAHAKLDLVGFNLLNLDDVVLASAKLDSAGKGQFALTLNSPTFALVKHNDAYIPVFLSPGDAQTVTIAHADKIKTPAYSGDGQGSNEYLQKINLANNKYQFNDYRLYEKISPEHFLARKDSLQHALDSLLTRFEEDKTACEEVLQIMRARNKVLLYSFTQNYVNAKFGYDPNNPEIQDTLKKLLADLPQDSLALTSGMFDYGLILSNHLQSGIMWPAGDKMDRVKTKRAEVSLPTYSEQEIEEKKYIRPLADHLKAANINFWLRMDGLSEELDTLWAHYRKVGSNPLYKETIQKSFDQWAALAPGKHAPDFSGTTAEGKSISLSSLKGKLVYVDVWATWCGPCREEFPHSKKLMKAFEGNDKIAFLYLSTDQNIDSWKKMLPDKSIPRGIHMHQKQEKQPDAVWENYHLWGIPRYILIDAAGKMLQTHAPRPSSKEILPLLKSYLKE